MRAVLPSLVLVACVHQRVVVHPVEVAHAAKEFRDAGHATLMMQREPIDPELHTLSMRDVVRAPLDPRSDELDDVTVGDLLQDCPPGPFALDAATRAAYPRCRLLAVAPRKIVVEDHLRLSGAAKTVAALAVVGGFGACTAACPEPWNYVAGGTLALAGATAVIGVAALMYVAVKMAHD